MSRIINNFYKGSSPYLNVIKNYNLYYLKLYLKILLDTGSHRKIETCCNINKISNDKLLWFYFWAEYINNETFRFYKLTNSMTQLRCATEIFGGSQFFKRKLRRVLYKLEFIRRKSKRVLIINEIMNEQVMLHHS